MESTNNYSSTHSNNYNTLYINKIHKFDNSRPTPVNIIHASIQKITTENSNNSQENTVAVKETYMTWNKSRHIKIHKCGFLLEDCTT